LGASTCQTSGGFGSHGPDGRVDSGAFLVSWKALQKRRKKRVSSRAMPLRRRRDRAPIKARTEEQSPARVRVPARQKAPRFLRRCRPSRGGIRGESRPERRAARDSRPRDESSRWHGCSKHCEKGTRQFVQERALAFAQVLRPTVCLVHASGTRRAKSRRVRNVARRSPVRQRITETDATGIGWCRRVAGRKPHSRARVERSSGVPARRFTVAEVGKLRRGSEKRASRWQRGAWTGAWLSTARKGRRGWKGVDRQRGGGQATTETKSEAGRSRGRCGATVLARWKTPRVTAAAHLVHAGARRVISAAFTAAHARASGVTNVREATGASEVRFARVTAGRQRPPRRLRKENVQPTEANRPERETGDLLDRAGAQAHDASRADEARVLVRRTWDGRSRSDASRVALHEEPQGKSAERRWPRSSPDAVLTHTVAAPRWERCVKSCDAFQPESGHGISDRGNPVDRDTTEGVLIVLASLRKVRRGDGLGRAGQREACAARRASSQLPVGSGTGEAVPARTTRGVRDRYVHGEGCSSRWGAGGPSHEAPRGAGPRTATTRVTRSMRKQHCVRVSRGWVDRSWPVRIARPSCPTARAARTDPGREEDAHGVTNDARHASCAHTTTRLPR